MSKPGKARLKEYADTKISAAFTLNCNEVKDTAVPGKILFEYTCKYTDSQINTPIVGQGTALSKKAAEHLACEKVLEILEAINNGGIHHGPTPMQINGVSPAPVPATNAVGGIFGATYVISNAQAEEAHQSTGRVDTNPGAITVISTDYLDPPEILQEATGPSTNKIGELLEYSVKNNLNPPTYEEKGHWIDQSDSMNPNRFKISCKFRDIQRFGVANSKMNAKKIAAYKVLQLVKNQSPASSNGNSSSPSSSPRPINPSMTPNARILPSTTAPVPTDAIKVTNKVVYFPSKRKGKGATATVFEGYFEVPIKKAAIKICSKDLIFHEKNRELDIMRKLVHPNLVAYFTYEEIEKTAYIVMELADCTLEDWVKLNAHSDSIGKLLKKFSMDATLGLNKLHDSNVVHRDLKPSNVLVFLTEKVAKLADFGISKELDSCTEGVVTEACRGTRIWMPPEGLRAIGSPIQFVLKPSFDIFALGLVIFYTMTKGKYLFSHKETESPVEIQANIINFKPNWNACMENKFTSLRNLLRAMTSLDPLKRPRTAVLLEHPFFWDDKKGLEFVLAVSNDLKNNEGKSAASDMNLIFQTYCQSRFPTFSWKARFCQELQEFMNHKDQLRLVQKGNPKAPAQLKLKKYNENSLMKLVEFIRDYYQHYEDWGKFDGMKEEGGVFGADGSQYGPYFMETFPELTTILYVVFQQIESQGIHLRPFYKLNLLSYFDRQLAQFELMMNK